MEENNDLKFTKIICTIGPASDTKEMITSLLEAGINVVRLNFSHGSYEHYEDLFKIISDIRQTSNHIFGVALDTKGPEIRAIMEKEIILKKGDHVKFTGEKDKDMIQIQNVDFEDIKKDYEFTLDDGLLAVKVISADSVIIAEALNDYILKPNKSVNMPGIKLKIPYLSEKDKKDIMFGLKHQVDYIFASFVSSKEDILDIKNLMEKEECKTRIIAKIESKGGLENLDDIITAADGVMVARGDLGAEIPLEQILVAQKMITKRCKNFGKPVIIATQMLENMINFPVPKRCEITDIGNSVLDYADCVMLSAESATGNRPNESVQMMVKIITETEKTQSKCLKNVFKSYNFASAIKLLSLNHNVRGILVVIDKIDDILNIYKKQKYDRPIFVVSINNQNDLQCLALYRNLVPIRMPEKIDCSVKKEFDEFLQKTLAYLQKKYEFKSGGEVIVCYRENKTLQVVKIALIK